MHKLVLSAVAALAATLSPFTAQAQPAEPAPAPEGPPAYLIRDVTIIDPGQGKAFEHYSVLIEGAKILDIREGPKPMPVPKGTEVIEGAGLFLMPGLFDAHVHYIDPATYGPLMLAHGVTFVRDLGSATASILAIREQLRSGELVGPDMIATGAIIDGRPPTWPFSEPCSTPEEGIAAVNKLADAGVDQIKVYSGLKPDVFAAVVKRAHERGLKATGHIPRALTIDDAIAAGQDCNEHLMALDKVIAAIVPADQRPEGGGIWASFAAWPAFEKADKALLAAELAKLREAKMHQCPTVIVMKGIGAMKDKAAFEAQPEMQYVPGHIRAFWNSGVYGGFAEFSSQAVKPMQGMVLEMHKAGVPLMVGTDLANAGVFAGSGLHDEMQLWQEAGIPAADILRAAITTTAEFCGVADRYGAVKAGKAASLVLLTANPLEDISVARHPHAVFHHGVYYDRAALDGLLAGVRARVGGAPAPPEVADKAAIDMSVPGEVVHKGSYKFKWGNFEAGSEDFVISKSDDGFHIKSHFKPTGGFQPPSVAWIHTGPDYRFREGSLQHLGEEPQSSVYKLGADGQTVESSLTGEAPKTGTTVKLPELLAYLAPSSAADYLTIKMHGLKPGDSKDLTAFGFGFGGWEPTISSMKLARKDDGAVERAGVQVPAQIYVATIDAGGMKMDVQYWLDPSGLILKSVTSMPFGVMEAVLQD